MAYHGWDADEIPDGIASQLEQTPSAYYYDHLEELDEDLETDQRAEDSSDAGVDGDERITGDLGHIP